MGMHAAFAEIKGEKPTEAAGDSSASAGGCSSRPCIKQIKQPSSAEGSRSGDHRSLPLTSPA